MMRHPQLVFAIIIAFGILLGCIFIGLWIVDSSQYTAHKQLKNAYHPYSVEMRVMDL